MNPGEMAVTTAVEATLELFEGSEEQLDLPVPEISNLTVGVHAPAGYVPGVHDEQPQGARVAG